MRKYVLLFFPAIILSGCKQQTALPARAPLATVKRTTTSVVPVTAQKTTSMRFATFSPDGKTFVLGLREQSSNSNSPASGILSVWDVRTKKKIGESKFQSVVRNVKFLGDSNVLLVNAGELWLCDRVSAKQKQRFANATDQDAVGLTRNGRFAAVVSRSDIMKVEVRDTKSWKLKKSISLHQQGNFIRSMDFSPDGRRLLIGYWDVSEGIETYSVRTGKIVWRAKGDMEGDLAWSPDGKFIAANVVKGVQLMRAQSGRLVKKIPADDFAQVQFSHDGRKLFFTNNGTLVSCRVHTQKIISKTAIKNLSNHIVSPNARVMALVNKDGSKVEFKSVEQEVTA